MHLWAEEGIIIIKSKKNLKRRDAEQERCWTGGIQDRWDAGQVGCRKRGNAEKDRGRREGCRTGGIQDRREAGGIKKSRDVGKEGCSKGGIQDWKNSGPEEGFRTL